MREYWTNGSELYPEADPDPNQRGGRRGGRDLSGGAAGGAETISGVGAEGHILYQGGQEGGQVIFEGGLVPPLAPPWIRHWLYQGFI